MGLCTSSIQEVALHSVNCSIDRAIELERAERENEIKLLLLGAGETGKSTILKQFRLIYGTGFTDQERISFRTAIIVNICQSIKTLLLAMDTLEIPFGFDPALYPHDTQIEDEEETLVRKQRRQQLCLMYCHLLRFRSIVFSSHSSIEVVRPSHYCAYKNAIEAIAAIDIGVGFLDEVDESVIGAIKTIWKDPGIQYCFKRANEFQLNDTCQYYLNDCDRFFASDYTPSDDDILNVRIMTLKVSETKVKVKDKVYKIFDVGGQRIERKKWAALFDDVIAIILSSH
ncbi:G-alpha-domain-containing protein [Rhizoclosmatium globosum]|uniref:G-alpha-domain-containing protein n=1 Tax=Rhizoclosmatium globosum TaxID=329046 RepID=A0A1Y2C398_9FUNG|nr:G-alpha-domain-containing protein [Rhizoclosmatium globosum]|eukprot:ORY41512.1 G-alpha-domain-containing protein [Rhizoclosmatium globosum]